MPYNTTAIPPRKEVTGQTQLPLSRVKKIIAQDQDIQICSNNAAFVITLATEMFIQYLSGEGQNMAKLERKPRRNVQYKDLANAVSHHDNLQFLEDIIPKTVTYRKIKASAAATRAQLSGGPAGADADAEDSQQPPQQDSQSGVSRGGSKKHKTSSGGDRRRSSGVVNGSERGSIASFVVGGSSAGGGARIMSDEDSAGPADPNDQLQSEMRQAARDEKDDDDEDDDDVEMGG